MGILDGADPGGIRSPWVRLSGHRHSQSGTSVAITTELLRRSLGDSGPAGVSTSLDDFLRGLSSAQSQRLESFWGVVGLEELRSLSHEADSAMYGEGLLELGRRHLDRSPQLALLIFGTIAERGGSWSQDLVRRANEERDAVIGQGSSSRRFEFLARNVARESTRPSLLAGMTLANSVLQVSRAALLSRLLASPTSSIATRGMGARFLANAGAFLFEVPAFSLGVRGVNAWLGPEQDWTLGIMRDELFGTALTLAGLKLCAFAGNWAVDRARGGPLARAWISQTASFGGIVAGRRLEEAFHLAPPRQNDTLVADSLVTLFHFYAAGRFANALLGEGFARSQAALEWRARRMSEASPRPSSPNIFSHANQAVAPAGNYSLRGPGKSRNSIFEEHRLAMAMMNQGDGSPSTLPPPPPAVSETPTSLGTIHKMLKEMVEERQRRNGEGNGDIALKDVLRERVEREKLAPRIVDRLNWAVFYRNIFDSSRILREELGEEALGDPDRLVDGLTEIGSRLRSELGRRFSLTTLVQSLAYGGRIPLRKVRSFLDRAAAFELYHRSSILREGLKEVNLADPVALIRRLIVLKPNIQEERKRRYTLSTLVTGASQAKNFPRKQLLTFLFAASAADTVESVPLKELLLTLEQLRELTRDQVFLQLIKLKGVFRKQGEDPASIGQILEGLRIYGLERVQDEEINDTQIGHAHVLNSVLDRWVSWGPHFAFLSSIPSHKRRLGWSRITYAREYLRKEDGGPYQDSTLGRFVPWGIFLYEHREALRLEDPAPISPRLREQGGLRSFAVDFFSSASQELDATDTESFILSLLPARERLLEAYRQQASGTEAQSAPTISLRSTLEAWEEAKGRENDRSQSVFAAAVDILLQRWPDWSPYLRIMARFPKHDRLFSRVEFARRHFRQSNGKELSDSVLNSLVRWGTLLWKRREELGLPDIPQDAPAVPVPADLAVFEFFERRADEIRLRPVRRWDRQGSAEVIATLLHFLPELESEISGNPEFEGQFPEGVDLSRIAANYLHWAGERGPTLERDATIVENILRKWESWQQHFHLLSRIHPDGRKNYIEKYFGDLPPQETKRWIRWGIWLWENREALRLPQEEVLLPGAPTVSRALLEILEREAGRLRVPKRVFRPSEGDVLRVARAMLNLRGQVEGRSGEKPSFSDLYEWTGYFTGKSISTFREAMTILDGMVANPPFWSSRLRELANLDDAHAARFLRKDLPGVSPERLDRYILLGRWLAEQERELIP